MWSRCAGNAAHVTVDRRSRGDMMGGTADGGQAVGLDAPDDVVRVREAAQAVGFSVTSVNTWIKSGRLTAHPSPRGRRVSVSAVRALCAPPDPQTPADARTAREVARAVGLPSWRLQAWAGQGLLPSWRTPHRLLVREDDVRAFAQKQGLLPRSDKAGA